MRTGYNPADVGYFQSLNGKGKVVYHKVSKLNLIMTIITFGKLTLFPIKVTFLIIFNYLRA